MADAAAAVDQSSSWSKEGEATAAGGAAGSNANDGDDDEEEDEEMRDDHEIEEDFEIVTFDLDQSPPGSASKLASAATENDGIDDDDDAGGGAALRASETTKSPSAAVASARGKKKKQNGKANVAAIAKGKIVETFKTGDLVWIKHSRYPIWPAFIHKSCGSMKSRKLKVIFSFIEYHDNLLFLNPKFKSTLIYNISIFPFSTPRREEFMNKILETKYSANICYIVSECDHYIIERAVGKEETPFDVIFCKKFTNSFGEMKYENNLGDKEPKYDESSTYDVSDPLYKSSTKNSIVPTPGEKITPRKKIYRPSNLENKIVDIVLTDQIVTKTLKNINLADVRKVMDNEETNELRKKASELTIFGPIKSPKNQMRITKYISDTFLNNSNNKFKSIPCNKTNIFDIQDFIHQQLIPYIIITAINHIFTLESDGLKLATRYFFTCSNSTRAYKLMEIDKYMSALEKIPEADRQSLKSKIISKISSIE